MIANRHSFVSGWIPCLQLFFIWILLDNQNVATVIFGLDYYLLNCMSMYSCLFFKISIP